ncbi:MAG TPA: bifunctional diaminohydroxyphosphoribosylaminopyrimidine deaminase/5-amino-6-(5-phosphoribosylamino)uracil reductase RibD [Candidatus Binatia bacterium]|nr:bifunctional diaminohydroxyphosphoribosylaminopyrimidine deaminase/5-amino-6-(5-phosphoribosylamino)uracil reductase RibD [Candidatus Binatia bacterium]
MAGDEGSEQEARYLRLACRLARRAAGRTSPNPMVGAVLVRGGKIVGTGYHHYAGGPHAEINALKQAGDKARGATLYITLEPCSHQGRTPPCTRALIGAGIREVVAGAKDPNPLVAGRGFQQLRRAGIKVRSGLCQVESLQLIEPFAKFITKRLPFVTVKLAATLDGKIATATGDARWISGEPSRALVHRWRNEMDAVLVGAGTVRADDPLLTCRIAGGRNPYRVVLDSRLRISPAAQLLRLTEPGKTIIATTNRAPLAKVQTLEKLGILVWRLPSRNGRVAWLPLLGKLANLGVVSLLIEGGGEVAASALKAKVVDKLALFYAPKLVGGDGRAMIGPLGVGKMAQALSLRRLNVHRCGDDVLLSGYL